MSAEKNRVFEFRDYREFLSAFVKSLGRGGQKSVASAMQCQAAYLIRVLRGDAQLTEEQVFRFSSFAGLDDDEFEFFANLVRLSKAGDAGLRAYLNSVIERKAAERSELRKRVAAHDLELTLDSQIRYYSSWEPSLIHVATNCPDLRTEASLARRLRLQESHVREILTFLRSNGLIVVNEGEFTYSGKSTHLPKESPLNKSFQRARRELALRSLDRPAATDLQFSSVFATSVKHAKKLRADFLDLIQESHRALASTESEQVHALVVDLISPG